MAKRGAEDQLTKDDVEDDRDPRDEDVVDPGVRDTPLAPVAGRQIRGMPKRKGFGGSPAPPAAAASAPAPAAPASQATASPFGGFAFGSTTTPSTSSQTPSFGFGGSSSAAPASSAPSSGFSFGKPAGTSPFSFGAKPAEQPSPTTAATKDDKAEEPPAKKPFGGFSFASAAAPTPPAPTSTSTSGAPAPASKPFSGFSFGSTTASNPTSALPAAGSASAPFAFGASSAPAAAKAPEPTPGAPATPPAEEAPQTSGVDSAPAIATSTSTSAPAPTPSLATPPPESEVAYYTSLRGLNQSILTFVTSTLSSQPFIHLGSILPGLATQYEAHLEEISVSSGFRPEGSKPKLQENGIRSEKSNPTPIKPFNTAAAEAPKMPAVGSFKLKPASTASTTTSGSADAPKGFVPTPVASSSGAASPFSFGGFGAKAATPDAPAEAKKSQEPKKTSDKVTSIVQEVLDAPEESTSAAETESAPKPFAFGSSSTPAASGDSAKKPSSLFSFAPSGPMHPATPDSKTFTPSSSLESPSAATATGTPKLGKFGPGGSQPQLAFGGAAPSSAGKGFSFSFGSGGASSPAGDSKAAPTFSFGSSSTGSGSGSTGFSFGSSAKPAAAAEANKPPAPSFSFGSTSAAKPSSGFSFGNSSASASASASAPSAFSFGSSSSSTPAPPAAASEDAPLPSSPSKNLAELAGAGEEGEETVLEQKAKLYKIKEGKFEAEGVGLFKLKRAAGDDAEKSKRRLLMRRDPGGNVILNMGFSKSFSATAEGPQIRFVGFDADGKPTPYTLRVKTKELAEEVVGKLKAEADSMA